MSELERSDHGAITESPTLLPGHGPGLPGHGAAVEPGTPEVVPEAEPAGSEPTTSETKSDLNGTPVLDENGVPKKRRRRGSRGGRGRKKPAGAGGSAAPPRTGEASDAPVTLSGSEDWTAASADRGLTDDDIAEQALEDAGLSQPGSFGANAPRA